MKQTDLFYTVTQLESDYGGYVHLHIEVYHKPLVQGVWPERMFEIQFQADPESPDWYGGAIELDRARNGIELKRRVEAAKVFLGAELFDVGSFGLGEKLRDRLGKIERRVYDPRLSEHVLPGEVLPPEYGCWRDEIERQCHVTAVARDEEEAQREILWQLADRAKDDLLVQFVQMGKPVRRISGEAPTVVPLDEALVNKYQRQAEPMWEWEA